MEKYYRISNGQFAASSLEESNITVCINPTKSEKCSLINFFRIDEHTLQSALDPDELSRIEFEPEHTAFIYKRPQTYKREDNFLFKVSSVGAFLFKDRLFLILEEEDDDKCIFETYKLKSCKSLLDLVLKLINYSTAHFREHLKVVNEISDDLQNKINISMENYNLIHLFSLQKSMVYYLNAINSNKVLLDKMKNVSYKIGFNQDETEILDDIIVDNEQCYRQAEISSNILVSLMDARATIVGNNLNVLMKKLNIITIGIMVPTLVVSSFSMNVRIPLSENFYAFYIIMAIAVLSVVGFAVFGKIKKY